MNDNAWFGRLFRKWGFTVESENFRERTLSTNGRSSLTFAALEEIAKALGTRDITLKVSAYEAYGEAIGSIRLHAENITTFPDRPE